MSKELKKETEYILPLRKGTFSSALEDPMPCIEESVTQLNEFKALLQLTG